MPIGADWRSLAPNPSAIGTTTPPIGGVVVPWHFYPNDTRVWRQFQKLAPKCFFGGVFLALMTTFGASD